MRLLRRLWCWARSGHALDYLYVRWKYTRGGRKRILSQRNECWCRHRREPV